MFAVFIFSGCSSRLVDFTIISTKNIDMAKSSSFKKGKSRIEGEDKVHIIIFIPTGQADIKECIDNAIEKVPGCVALLDGVLYSKSWWIPYIYGQAKFVVEGTPLIDETLAYIPNTEMPDYSIIELNNSGKFKTMKAISQTEYIALKEKISKDSSKKILSLKY